MSLGFRYFNVNPGGFDVDLGDVVARLWEHGGFSMKAEAGNPGLSEVILDDPNADIGNSGDGILGLQGLDVSESDCAAVGADGVNGQLIFTGYTGQRVYSRGDSTRSSLITGTARQIRVAIADQNIYSTWRLNRDEIDGNRPAETDVERVRWLISGQPTSSAPFFYVTDDAGWIDDSNPVDMDACDYTDQPAADVLQDCALHSGKNWFLARWEATGNNVLWYRNSNTSTLYTSLLRISNVLSDVDNVTTFAPERDASLLRSPDFVFAGVVVAGNGVRSYQTNATTGDTYGWRDGSGPNANISTQAQADAVALRMVNAAATEDDHVSVTVQLPSSLATGIKVGQRIECRFSHLKFGPPLPDYSEWTWFRVTSLQIAQDEKTDQRYTLALELSPQDTAVVVSCSARLGTIVSAVAADTLNHGAPSVSITPTAGLPTLLLGIMRARNGNTPTCKDYVVGAGYTLLDAYDPIEQGDGNTAALVGIEYRAVASPSGAYTVDADFSAGFDFSGIDEWRQVALAIQTSNTTPVQSVIGYTATLPSDPMPGNLLVGVFALSTSPTGTLDQAGWTVFESGNALVVAARCVQPGDGRTWSITPDVRTVVALSEWALT